MAKLDSKKLCLISLGCSKNLVDSEVMLGALSDYSLTNEVKEADVIIVNTCGFINSAKTESIQTILQANNEKKDSALLVVSGCLGERYEKELKESLPEIDILLGVKDYANIKEFIDKKNKTFKIDSKVIDKLESKKVFLVSENDNRVITGSNIHAYIKLSEGCNQSCSFCSIPSFKGKLQSRSISSVLNEIENLALKGYKDFSFIAQDSSSYLRDFGVKDGLISLIKALDSSGLNINARIHYLYPTTTNLALIQAIAESKIVENYFDMPIQHISDSMLKIMKRGADKKTLLTLLDSMKNVESSFIRSSLIVGHPGEGEKEFNELLEFLEMDYFDRLNFFAFSSEEGTKSHTMKDKVPNKIINKRINALNKVFKKNLKNRFKSLVGNEYQAIIENRSEVSEHFYSARLKNWGFLVDGEILINDIQMPESNIEVLKPDFYNIKITSYKNNFLFATATGLLKD